MQELILLCLVAASPWLAGWLPRMRVVPLAAVVLCCGVVAGPLFFAYDVGIQVSLDRVLLAAVLGLAGLRLWQNGCQLPKCTRVDVLVLLLAAWLLASAIPTTAPASAEPPLGRWITFVAIPLAMYLIARIAPLNPNDCRLVITALVGLGIYLGVIGLCEVLKLHALVYPKYIVDASNWEFFGRARGPLLNPTGNGTVLAIALAASLTRVFQGKRLEQVIYGAAAVLIALGITATLTRSVWIGGMLVCMLFGLIYLRSWLVAAGTAGVGLLVLILVLGSTENLLDMKRDEHLSAADAAKSVQLRPVLALVAWEMIKDKPLTGHGFGGYFHSSLPYLSSRAHDAALDSVRPYMQHNVILSLLVDGGLIAASLMITWLVLTGRAAWQLASNPVELVEKRGVGLVMLACLAAYLFNGMFHDVSVIPMASNFLFFLSGLTTSVAAGQLQPAGATAVVRRPATPLKTGLAPR